MHTTTSKRIILAIFPSKRYNLRPKPNEKSIKNKPRSTLTLLCNTKTQKELFRLPTCCKARILTATAKANSMLNPKDSKTENQVFLS